MGLPTPTPDQIDALEGMKAVADAGVVGAAQKEAAIQEAIDKQQEIEDFQKLTFDALNDDIIGKYEIERKQIDGQGISSPVVEADIQTFAADGTGRLDNGGNFAPLRIPEFDGGPLTAVLPDVNETELFTNQDNILTVLQTGYAGQVTIDPGSTINGSIDDSSSSLIIDDNITVINPNDVLFIAGGGLAALVKVLTYNAGGFCTPTATPDTEAQCTIEGGVWTPQDTITFEYIVKPGGTIPAGSDIGQKTFSGFNNAERTSKTASDGDFQPFMNSLVSQLQTNFENRKTALQAEIAAIQTNEDDNIDLTAETKANDSVTAIDGFLGVTPPSTMDISDTGITAINNEKAIRQPQLATRIADIASAIATGGFYDQRFGTAEGRCRLNNGSIVLLNDLQSSKTNVQAGGVEAQGLSDRYDALIP